MVSLIANDGCVAVSLLKSIKLVPLVWLLAWLTGSKIGYAGGTDYIGKAQQGEVSAASSSIQQTGYYRHSSNQFPEATLRQAICPECGLFGTCYWPKL